MDPLMRPLKRGEVGVSFLPGGVREIVPEADYTLVDRTFQSGDYCKRSIDDVRSGVVVSTEVQVKLVHAITGEPVPGWKGVRDLRHATCINGGDYVVYDDWIGQVSTLRILVSCFPAYLYKGHRGLSPASAVFLPVDPISFSTNSLFLLQAVWSDFRKSVQGWLLATKVSCVTSNYLRSRPIPTHLQDILPNPHNLRGIYDTLHRTPMPTPEDTVVDVKHTVLAVCWLAVNQSVSTSFMFLHLFHYRLFSFLQKSRKQNTAQSDFGPETKYQISLSLDPSRAIFVLVTRCYSLTDRTSRSLYMTLAMIRTLRSSFELSAYRQLAPT